MKKVAEFLFLAPFTKELEIKFQNDNYVYYIDLYFHKFFKWFLFEIWFQSGKAEFEPYFDSEAYPFLQLILIDGRTSNFVKCRNCCQLLCFFALNINSGGKVQTNTLKKHSAICSGPPLEAMFANNILSSQSSLAAAQILADSNLSFDQSSESNSDSRISLPFSRSDDQNR